VIIKLIYIYKFNFLENIYIYIYKYIKYTIMNIGFSLDNNYVDLLINTINSILQHNIIFINIYIITDNILTTNSIKNKIKIIKNENFKLFFKVMEQEDVDFYSKNTRTDNELRKDINVINYGQILFNKYFDIDKILYLEADQIIINSLEMCYNIDIENIGIAAIPIKLTEYDKIIKNNKIINNKDYIYNDKIFYFNAGVTLLDFRYWKKNNLFEKFNSILINNNNNIKEHLYLFYSQGILNILFYNKYKYIDKKYNCVHSDQYLDPINIDLDKPVILHYNGQILFNIKNDILNDWTLKWIEIYKKYDIMNILSS